jgi:hypothetical protein
MQEATFEIKLANTIYHESLPLVSGATALGSVILVSVDIRAIAWLK